MNRLKMLTTLFAIIGLSAVFSAAAIADDIQNSKILPEGKVLVFEDGKQTASFSKEMPVPEGTELLCEEKCAIKLEDLLMVAEDQARFSIEHRNNSRVLNVKEGMVYFGASGTTGSLVFLTPKGAAISEQIMINASSDSRLLEGYVKVTDDSSEVGVLRGGSMTLATRDDTRHIRPGQSLILAQADIGGSAGAETPPATTGDKLGAWWGSLSTGDKIVAGIAGGAAVGITAAGIHAATDGRDDDASPIQP